MNVCGIAALLAVVILAEAVAIPCVSTLLPSNKRSAPKPRGIAGTITKSLLNEGLAPEPSVDQKHEAAENASPHVLPPSSVHNMIENSNEYSEPIRVDRPEAAPGPINIDEKNIAENPSIAYGSAQEASKIFSTSLLPASNSPVSLPSKPSSKVFINSGCYDQKPDIVYQPAGDLPEFCLVPYQCLPAPCNPPPCPFQQPAAVDEHVPCGCY